MMKRFTFVLAFALCCLGGWAVGRPSDGKIALGKPAAATRAGALKTMSEAIRAHIRPETGAAGFALMALTAAAYGIIHALGPGHQKTLISGYIIAEGGGFFRVVQAAGIAAATHALSVVVLFGGLALLTGGLTAAKGEYARVLVTRSSAALLVVLASWILFLRVRTARERFVHDGHPECSCPHHREEKSSGTSPIVLFLGSLVPCPGAAFFLLLGFSAGNPVAGIVAVIAVSLGMWATLIAVGGIALVVRKTGEAQATKRGNKIATVARSAFEIGGGAVVLVFAFLLFFY